jgi:hypothetical protein
METSTRFRRADDKPLGELVQDLSRQTSTLIRQEMRLAQAELAEKGRHAGRGAGMFGGALLLIAGTLAPTGKKELEEAGPPKPEQALDSVQRDIETVKERATS